MKDREMTGKRKNVFTNWEFIPYHPDSLP